MKNTFEQQIYEIFGTTDPKELRKLSKDAKQYQQLAKKEALRHAAGRKPAFSLPQIIQMAAMQQQGKSIAEIARTFQVSRQTVYNQIARAHCFSTDPDVKTRMCFLYRDQLCTTIDIDFRHEKIAIQNYTKKIPLRAFGVVEHPTWDDFTWFLESRCFPKTRDHAKDILKEMVLPFYDPLLIIEKTDGRMAGDEQWILMEQIRLDNQLPVKKTDHTSKGDQLKWKIGNIWYKSDYMGYEGLSETLVSHLLQKSTLSHPFVLYQPVRIAYRGTLRSGCSSPDFLKANQMLIPLEKLYRQNTGDSLAITLAAFSEPAERIRFLADQMEHMTGIQNFGAYLTAMLEIDAFFLNEDRHTNNIAVLYDTETEQYSPSPLFDQGLCLFADISNDYPLDLPMDVCMERIEAKPFSSDFDTQLDAAEELYGIQLHFSFTAKDVCTELDSLADYYPLEIRQRVEQIIRRQMRKYGYLMRS